MYKKIKRWRKISERGSQVSAPLAPLIEELEPRLLFSADAAGLFALDPPGSHEAVTDILLDENLEPVTPVSDVAVIVEQRLELVFVDTDTPDHQQLVDDLLATVDNQRQLEVVVLDNERDGVEQISEILQNYRNVDAIHLISHGQDGSFDLGSTQISSDSLDDYQDQLQTWGQFLNADADILIYGCDLAASADGQFLIDQIAQLTGADIAASDDLTGSTALGGDWVLEYNTGAIQNEPVISTAARQAYDSVLATFVVDTVADTVDANPGNGVAEDASGNTSLRAAIEEANALAGADIINFEITTPPVAGAHTIQVGNLADGANGPLPAITEAVTIDGTTDTHFLGTPIIELDGSAAGSGDVAAGRRVVLPWAHISFLTADLNANGETLMQRSLTWASGNLPPGNLLFVVQEPGSLLAEDSAKKSLLETWGYTVNLIDVNDTQENFVLAVAANDVVFITKDIASADMGTKLRDAAIGVVTEELAITDVEFGLNSSHGWDMSVLNLNIVDDTHYITSVFPTGDLQVFDSAQELQYVTGSEAPDLHTLGTTASGDSLVIIDAGDQLYDGGSVDGLSITAGNTTVRGLVINRFSDSAIEISTGSGNVIQGNYIGTDVMGSGDPGNGLVGNGIEISAGSSDNEIGGAALNEGNIIANQPENGVYLNDDAGDGNAILGNAIFSNGGLGIELVESGPTLGVTPNDPGDSDVGANNLQNYPVISDVVTDTVGAVIVSGSLATDGLSQDYRIEFFASSTADGSGYGEAERYLDAITVTTDVGGLATFSAHLSVVVAGTEYLTATATVDGGVNDGNSSEFAQSVQATINNAPTLNSGSLTTVDEDTASPAGEQVSTIFAGQFGDVDAGSSFGGIAVVGNSANATTQGSWQYSTNSGTNWFDIGTVADDATALAVSSSTLVRFLPVADYNGNPPALVVRGMDNTYVSGYSTTAGSETRINVNTTTTGNPTAIAAATANLSTSIAAVNDAPVEVSSGTNFNGHYAYNDFGGSWFVETTPVDTGTIVSQPQGAVIEVSSSAGGSSSSAVITAFDGSLTLGDLYGGSFSNTGDTLSMNIYLDTGNDGQFFSFTGSLFTGLNGDSFGTVTLDADGGTFSDDTVFTKSGGIAALPSTFTLGELKTGSVAGIDTNTHVAFWIGGGNSFSSDISTISLGANTTESLTVLEDSGLTSLGLGGFAPQPGGGADEAGQTLSYTVTTVPGGANGNVVLSDGTTVVTASTSYSLLQIQGMQFKTTANTNGAAGTFSFEVQDSGGTPNGGEDTITRSITLNVTPDNDAPVGNNDSYTLDEDGTLVTGDWQYQRVLTFDNTAQAEHLADFPVLVKLDNSRINYAATQDNGEDLRFFDSTGTQPLAHEIEEWDEGGTSYVWVNVPVIDGASGTDSMTMVYGNANAVDGQDPEGVWGADYKLVYHLNDDSGLSGSINDSSPSSFDGTNHSSTNIAGAAGDAQEFDGTTYVDVGSDLPILNGASAVTLSAWINPDATNGLAGTQQLVSFGINAGGPTPSSRVALALSGTELGLLVRPFDNATEQHALWTTSDPLVKGIWQHITLTVDIPNDIIEVTVDGVAQPLNGSVNFATASALLNTDSSSSALGGEDDGSGSFFVGAMDEVRVSTVARSADWLAAQTDSVNDAGFISFGPEQSVTTANGVLANDSDAEDPITAVLVDDVSDGVLALNPADGSFTYTPTGDFNGDDSFTYRANDGTVDSGLTTVTITVNPVNDAPVLDNSEVMFLSTITEDETGNSGNLVSDIIASGPGNLITDVDTGDPEGIAINSLVSSNGTWQYDIGTGWINVGDVSFAESLLLRATDSLRFVPDGIAADTAFVTFAAWDQATGAPGAKVNTSTFGGTTAFSAVLETAAISVTAVNDAPTGSVLIDNMTPGEGSTLNASNTLADIDGLGSITYQWQRDGVDISGENSSSYTTTALDIGATINVLAEYTDGGGFGESVSSAPTAAVTNVNDAPVGTVTISGIGTEDEELTASNDLTDADGMGAITYQWQRDGSDISGENAGTYTLTQTDVGTTITVLAEYTDGGGFDESVSSAGLGPIANLNDAPVITSNGGLATAAIGIAENSTVVTTVTATDADFDTPIFTITDGDDQLLFSIDSSSGMLTFKAPPDYENPADAGFNNSYEVEITASDGNSGSDTQLITITVGNKDPIANGSWFDETDGGGGFADFATLVGAHSAYVGTTEQIIDMESLSTGEVLSNQFTVSHGVTFSNTGVAQSQVYAEGGAWIEDVTGYDGSYAADGSNVYLKMANDDPATPFTIEFASPVAKVSALLGMGKEGTNHDVNVRLYDAGGNLIDQRALGAELWDVSPADQNYETFLGIQYDTATISKIEILNDSNVDYANVLIFDQLSWSTTPDAADFYTAVTTVPVTTGNVLANDIDPAGGALSITGFTQAVNGTTAYNGDGTFNYTSDLGFTGTDTFTYTISDGNGGSDSATVSILVSDNNAPTGSVLIDNMTPGEGTTLNASNTLADLDGLGSISYQWQRDGVDITGETGNSYTTTATDIGATINVLAEYTDGGGSAESVSSAPTAAVSNVNDAPTGTVTIAGTGTEDQTLTASNTLADADGMGAITYQWQRDGSDISGENASTYTLTQTDVGTTISVLAEYTDGGGFDESVSSAGLGPIANVDDAPTGLPTISGTVTEDETLTADTTGISDEDGISGFGYQWTRDGAPIAGATSNTYDLDDADVGTVIRVEVSYTDDQGNPEGPLVSAPTAAVANINDAPTGSVLIDNMTPGEGTTLNASNTLADIDGLGSITYQWQRDGVDISGENSSSYTTTALDIGATINVLAEYTDGGGFDESVSSAPTAAIVNVNDAPVGTVTITGTGTEDEVLTASNDLTDADGMGSITYQWQRDGSDISGENASTYTLTQADVDTTITVLAEYTDGGGFDESVSSAGLGPINNVDDAPTGLPVITGTATEDETLTADTTGISDEDGISGFGYQWTRDGAAITGATASTYDLDDADVGTIIRVEVSYTDDQGNPEGPLVSAPTAAIVNVNDAPSIIATATQQAYTENDGLLVVDAGLIVSDVDNGDLTGATISIVTGFASAEDMLAFVDTPEIFGSYNAGTGVLTLSGPSSVENYQAALRSVAYANSSEIPDTTNRVINFTVTDGAANAGATRTLTVASINDDPTMIGTLPLDVTVKEDVMDFVDLSAVTFSDVDANNGLITLTLSTDTGGNLSASSDFDVTVLGSGTDTLTLTGAVSDINNFFSSASRFQYLHGTTHTAGNNVDTIELQINDNNNTGTGGSGTILLGSVNVDITAINDAPQGTDKTVTAIEDTDYIFLATDFGFTDTNDSPSDSLLNIVIATAPSTGILYLDANNDGIVGGAETLLDLDTVAVNDINTGLLKFKPGNDDNGTNYDSFTFQVQDDGGNANSGVNTDQSVNTITIDVTPQQDTPTGTVTIAGTGTEDQTLTASNTLADVDGMGSITYQWQRDGSDISGENASTYTLVQADVGTTITVLAEYTDGGGFDESVSSAGLGPIANVDDAPSGLPTISGTVTEDETLTADTTGISDEDGISGFGYQWTRDGAAITGATSNTYDLDDADVGTVIRVEVSYTDDQGNPEGPLVSAPTAAVANINDAPTGSVLIDNMTPGEGTTLNASNTLADVDGLGSISYQWQRDGVDITGETGTSYTTTATDIGETISVIASYTDGGGFGEMVSSAATAPVANVNDAPTGTVTISGTGTEDQTLTASNTLADADGIGTITYQWQRDGSDISGENASTYTLVQADVGASISVLAEYTDDGGTDESVSSAGLGPIANVDDAPTGLPTISGTVTEDETLTADTTGISDEDGISGFGYQWTRDGAPIAGATSNTYDLDDADVGTLIRVEVSYTDDQGNPEGPLVSAPTAAVANINDAPTGSVLIDNMTPGEGTTLNASNTLADIDGLGSITYQWQRDGVDISGENSSSYTTTALDIGATINVLAEYTDGGGFDESVSSAPTAAIVNVNDAPVGTVTITGTGTEDEVLTASNDLTDADGMGSITYQWQRDGSDISGENASTYTLTQADVDTTITVLAEYTDGGGFDESVSSAGLGPINNVDDAPTGLPVITGTATEDETLTADTTGISDEDGISGFGYQWTRDGAAITGATASTYDLDDADVGTIIRVEVSYTDDHGNPEGPLVSAPTAAVANINDAPTGSVLIDNMTPGEGTTLNASNTLADIDGLGAITYQWQRDGVDISGENGTSYTTTALDIGATINVLAEYTDGGGFDESVSSAPTAAVTNVNDAPTGTVTIAGTGTEDQTLTASNTLADADGMGAITYQWQRDGSDISGENASTYTLTQTDVGTTVSVLAEYTDGGGFDESVSSAGLGPIANVDDAPTGLPTISGTVTEDETLTADTTGISDEDGISGFGYQWTRDGAPIAGATSNTYDLDDADVGTVIRVEVSYTDDQGNPEGPLVSAPTAAVANINDAPTGSVLIDNMTPGEGTTLNASNTLADIDGLGSITYQWQRDGVDISGENSSSYTTTALDIGATINVLAEYTDGGGFDESVSSAPTAAVSNVNDAPTGTVTIAGTGTEDQTLTASNTLADADGMGSITYQWQRDGSDISGENASTYTLTQTDVGTTITVLAEYTDGGGFDESVSSAGLGPIANVDDAPTGLPVITGTATEDETLTADTTGISDEDGISGFGYQWTRDGAAITGATSNTYDLDDADVGTLIRVEVSYTDDQGNPEGPLVSAPTAAVANINDAPTGSVLIDNMTPGEGTTLNASNTLADIDGLGSITYQWQRDGSDISGATGASYTTTATDIGATINVLAEYTDGGGFDESVSSAPTAAIVNVNDAPVGTVTISGIGTEDEELTASNDLTDADGMGSITYQWQRDGSDISGENAATYTLTQADVDTTISVLAEYTDGGGFDESVSSAGLGPIANVDDAPTGLPTISGTVTEDETLTADTTGISDEDGISGFGYQWTRDGAPIAGATSNTYDLDDADVGTVIRVEVSYTDDQGNPEGPLVSAPTAAVANINDAPTGSVLIDNMTPGEGTTLNASNTLADIDGLGSITYQWQRDGVDISGENSSSYTTTALDIGATINVLAEYTDGGGFDESVSSAPTAAIVNVNDAPVGTVTITGTGTEDEVLTASNDLTDADGMGSITYQWQRDGSDISGENASTYTLTQADVDTTITVLAEYTDGGGFDESVSSAGLGPINNVDDAPTGLPVITGTATEDETLTADTTGISDEDGISGFGYQWTRDGAAITGATASTYDLDDADVGTVIRVEVSYTDDQGNPEGPLVSAPTAAVANINDAPTGSVLIDNMTPGEGTTLNASNTLADVDGLGSISYQWQRDGVDITGETGTSYTTTATDIGETISVIASYTDGGGFGEMVSSAATAPVANVNDAPTGTVTISGTGTEDQTLTASNTLADADGIGTITYQWQRDGSDISGENASTYTLVQADVGASISVLAEYTDDGGTDESVSSAGLGPIANVDDAPTGLPTISGTVTEDETLTADTTGISDEDGISGFGYQWTRDGAPIAGATSNTYDLDDADVGTLIRVEVSYTDDQGNPEGPLVSAPTAAVANINDAPTGSVLIDNMTPGEGTTLNASNTLADIDGLGSITYQWQRDGVDISGENSSSYTTTALDIGATINVLAEYTDGGGFDESVSSAPTAAIVNVNDAPVGTVTITGTGTEDEVLTASNDLTDADGMGSITYQWQRDGSDISGENASTYTLTQADVDTTITVLAEYTDGGGFDESVSSAGLGPIANLNDAPTGSVLIDNMTPAEGGILNASNTLADADGLGSISYQWQRDGSDISGATTSSYTTVAADVGKAISVVASYTDDEGTPESVSSALTAPVSNTNNAPGGSVSISGTPTEDQTLTAANTLTDADGLGAITYQWQRDGSDISGETAATYTLTQADVSSTITVIASYTDGGGTDESVSSAGIGPVANLNDAPTGSVVIDNMTPAEGATLNASNTLADDDGLGAISYQWQRDGSDISGATGASYTTGASDIGSTISVIASYTDGEGTDEAVSSAATAPVSNTNSAPTGSVLIDNMTPAEGATLNASNTLADDDGLGAISYQWQRDGSDISGATGASYTTGASDIGSTISVIASYTDGEGTDEAVSSAATAPVSNTNSAPTGSVLIDNMTPAEGATLNASNTLADDDGLGAISYQWQRDGSDISGATGASYTTGASDIGSTISVIASYTDGEGTDEAVSSAATAPVSNTNSAPTGSVLIDNMTPAEGATLNASNTLADDDGLGAISYQWQRDGSDISGATGASYTTGASDIGSTISVIASYTDGEGTDEAVSSAATAPISNTNSAPTGSVLIDNMTPAEGATLNASNTLADDDGLGAISYQWQRDGSDISGATGASYTTGASDIGSTISVIASYTDGEGTDEAVSSAATAPVSNTNSAPTGSVLIDNMTPAEGATLNASNTLADDDGLGAISYQWQRDGSDISGATGASYTTGASDIGSTISVIASYTDGEGTDEAVSSAATAPVSNTNSAPTGSVLIDNMTPAEGATLNASNTLADDDGLGAISYQWQRDGSDISGATGASYTTTAGDIGSTISVIARYTDGGGTDEAVSSAATTPFSNTNSAPTGEVTISGTPTEDQTLTVTNTLADEDGLGNINYQWQRNGINIAGATDSNYTLIQLDVDNTISVRASYMDGGGTNEVVGSNALGPVVNVNDAPTGAVTIDNMSPAEGVTLRASNTLADEDGIGTISYQWQRNGEDIIGAVGSAYTTGEDDVGAAISVKASYTDEQGTPENRIGGNTASVSSPAGPELIPEQQEGPGTTETTVITLLLENEEPVTNPEPAVEEQREQSPALAINQLSEPEPDTNTTTDATPTITQETAFAEPALELPGSRRSSTPGQNPNTPDNTSRVIPVTPPDRTQPTQVVGEPQKTQVLEIKPAITPTTDTLSVDQLIARSHEQLELTHLHSVLNSHAMWQAIDTMNQEIEGTTGETEVATEELVVQVVGSTSLGLVAGTVAYALRGGALLASLVSAMPLWSVYDPLPVLARPDKKDRKDEETAEDDSSTATENTGDKVDGFFAR